MIIKFPEEEYNRMLVQARQEFPMEACGLVGGIINKKEAEQEETEIEVKRVYPMTNIDDSEEHFSLAPEEQFAVAEEIRDNGQEIIGNYHSHPHTPARPSSEDKRLAYDEEIIYFILSLQQKNRSVLKAFQIRNQQKVTGVEVEFTK